MPRVLRREDEPEASSIPSLTGEDPAGRVSEDPRGAGAGDPEADQEVPMLVTQGTELMKSPDPGYANDPQLELGGTEPSENPSKKEQGVEATTQQGSSPPLLTEEEDRSHLVQSLLDQMEEKIEGEEKEKVDEKEEDVGEQEEKVDDMEEKTHAQKGKVNEEEEKVDGGEEKVDGEDEDQNDGTNHDDFSELLQEVMRLLSPEKGGWR